MRSICYTLKEIIHLLDLNKIPEACLNVSMSKLVSMRKRLETVASVVANNWILTLFQFAVRTVRHTLI